MRGVRDRVAALEQFQHRDSGLLWDHAVAEGLELRRPWKCKVVTGDPRLGKPHHPLDEQRRKSRPPRASLLGRVWGGAVEGQLPLSDRRFIDAPVQEAGASAQLVSSVGIMPRIISMACSSPGPERRRTIAGRLLRLPPAKGVGNNSMTAAVSPGFPFESLLLGDPLVASDVVGVGNEREVPLSW